MANVKIREEMIAAREEYIEIIKAELLGPGSEFSIPDAEHEIISASPTGRYSVGILFPQGNMTNRDNNETVLLDDENAEADGEETFSKKPHESDISNPKPKNRSYSYDETADENLDEEINMSTQYNPSSMGMTFFARGNCDIIHGKLNFATYRSARVSDCMLPYCPPGNRENYAVPQELAHLIEFDTEHGLLRLKSIVKKKEVRDIFERDTIPENEISLLEQIMYRFADYCASGNARISDYTIPYDTPISKESYKVSPALAHLIEFDSKYKLLRLKRIVKKKEIYDIFERSRILSSLKQIMYRFADYCAVSYVREPHEVSDFVLDFFGGDYIDNEATRNLDGTSAKIVALRRKINKNVWAVTVMLVNALEEESPAKPYHCLYQAKIDIGTDNNKFVFAENNVNAAIDDMDDEERSLDMLYRHKKSYGTGLGTSVDWKIDDNGHGHIWNDFFPTVEIPSMSFSLPDNDLIRNEELSMKYLSDLSKSSKEEKLSAMQRLVDLYKKWVDGLEKTAETLESRYRSAAIKNISECKRAYKRMYAGVKTLESNDNAYNAFLLANRAMFMQRIHIAKQSEMAADNADRYSGDEEISAWLKNLNYETESDRNCVWRPFQIAFLLMDVNSIVDDNSDERSVVDLIWFPTGGGKTEAYLGLTAFTIFYRRLAHPDESGGTTVIMRYTLRLLAAQQFTRAATLICACEYIRKDCEKRHKYPSYPLGKTPVTIGLWLGSEHIPNKNTGKNSAKEHLDELSKAYVGNIRYKKDSHNKFQVLKCPWCGTKMVKDNKNGKLVGNWGYRMENGKHFRMFCPHEDCNFTNRLPIQIIDEELYDDPPTLLFGTVDKFAMLPWDGHIGAFFGSGGNNRAPELIIQDELHLISGALGTIVGLFETAVDYLCGQKGVSPKIIASTATIRRAKEQCSVLYNREVVQFPAPGLDAEDSFFAKESAINHEHGVYGRKYVGIMPSGKTKAMTEIRLMAALLQKLYTADFPEEIKDKFWTLTAYFNSLKDLGRASNHVDDDVKDFIVRTANRMFKERRLIVGADELTSRVSTTELNETLDKLEKIEYSQANIENKRYASNVLLATNMISVGIDLARLNVMLMVGQPKLTSEYIQASSRVGRSYPGVVFVQYDATKSRDRSHYEDFHPYHRSFYRFVEPTGATPFSKPARERALHSVLIAMLSNKAGLTEDKDAGNFDKDYFSDQISEVEKFVTDRVEEIDARANGRAFVNIKEINDEMEKFFDTWQCYVDECKKEKQKLFFGKKHMVNPPADGERRLLRQFNSRGKDDAFNTLTSMRNVDTSVKSCVVIWGDENV